MGCDHGSVDRPSFNLLNLFDLFNLSIVRFGAIQVYRLAYIHIEVLHGVEPYHSTPLPNSDIHASPLSLSTLPRYLRVFGQSEVPFGVEFRDRGLGG